MNNPIAQLMAQAEVGLADFSRRTIESVTLPIRLKSQEVVADVSASVKASAISIAIKAGLSLFAGVMLIIALGYGLSALHGYLATVFSPIEATLIMAGVFLALAVIALLVLAFWPSGATKRKAAVPSRVMLDAEAAVARARSGIEADAPAAKGQARAQAKAAQPTADTTATSMADMTSGLGAIAAALGEAGFKKEQAGLRAGLAIAQQLKPMQIVSLALIGGFIAGARYRRRG
jgi:hypothetical protein